MRAVCFVKRLEFATDEKLFQNPSVALGDVDNDGNNELVVGHINGILTVYKNKSLWEELDDLGMITSIAVGDITNCGNNSLVVIAGDGVLTIYYRKGALPDHLDPNDRDISKIQMVHLQRVPANIKVALLADIDGDGRIELVLGLTDRVVRSYRWIPFDDDEPRYGKLIGLNKWECAKQIGGLSHHFTEEGAPCILVAQPGGTYMKICCHKVTDIDENNTGEESTNSTVSYHPLSSARMRNSNVSTEILGCIKPPGVSDKDQTEMLYAVATLDGTLMLLKGDDVLWSIQVDHQLFSLSKLNITGKESEEIVACSWDGQTYILDQQRTSIRFQFEDTVSGFCSGYYTVDSLQGGVPCFVYVTYTGKIYLYYDITLPNVMTRTLQIEKEPLNKRKKQRLVEWLLYSGRKSKENGM